MATKIGCFLGLAFIIASGTAWSADAGMKNLSIPIVFEPNVGQFSDSVRFVARTPDYQSLIRTNGIDLIATPRDGLDADTVELRLVGSRSTAQAGEQKLESVSNYLYGDHRASHSNVSNFASVRFIEAYPGIDWVLYGSGRELEHDFVVKPHADIGRIGFRFEGAKGMRVRPDGTIEMHLSHGSFIQKAPVAYQLDDAGRRKVIPVSYTVHRGVLHFAAAHYNQSRELIIDPPLAYSTYLGGTHADMSPVIAVDGSGNVYLAGHANSTDFPTLGTSLPSGNHALNLFVTKLNASGSALIYSTYFGGSTGDVQVKGIAVDSAGDLYLGGAVTADADFPTVSAYQSVYKSSITGGSSQGFIAKIGASGSQLIFSTYLGGTGLINQVAALAIDSGGNVFVTGSTSSTDFPFLNGVQNNLKGRMSGFVSELSSDGHLLYSTYLGGSAADMATGIALDSTGAVIVVGNTNSLDFPLYNALQSTNKAAANGSTNPTGFVTKIVPGAGITFSTYLGGSAYDLPYAVAVDSQSNVVVAGSSVSLDYPVKNAIQSNFKAVLGGSSAVVSKLSSTGTLLWSTYLSGSGGGEGLIGDNAFALAIDSADDVFIAGSASSSDYPTVNAVQTANKSTIAAQNAVISEIAPGGGTLLFSTYLGGSTSYGNDQNHTTIPFGDIATGLAVQGSDIYVTGQTASDDFPTMHAYQAKNNTTTQYGTNPTIFVAKFGTQVSGGGGGASGGSLGGGSSGGGGGALSVADLLVLVALSAMAVLRRVMRVGAQRLLVTIFLAQSVTVSAHDLDERPIHEATELRDWCKSAAEAEIIGRGGIPSNWSARYWDEGNTLNVEGQLRVGAQRWTASCRIARHAQARFASLSLSLASSD